MPRPKALSTPSSLTISCPFDARHIAGVDIQGTQARKVNAMSNPAIPRTHHPHKSTYYMEPDEIPTHMNISPNSNSQPPKRSHSIARTLSRSRPSLRLKTSISRLRGRSTSYSPDTTLRKDEGRRDDITAPSNQYQYQTRIQTQPPQLPAIKTHTSQISIPSSSTSSTHQHTPPPEPTNRTHPNTKTNNTKNPPLNPLPTRPKPPKGLKRIDSGTSTSTTITFTHIPANERPLGFREILAVKSFEERMRLYGKSMEYWACADHGLGEWNGCFGGMEGEGKFW